MFTDSDVYLRGVLEVDSIYCTGQIFFEDLGNRFENDEQKKMETGVSNLYQWNNSMKANDLLIDGNIVFSESVYMKEEIFEKLKLTTHVHPKIMTIKCDNFLIGNKIISKNNCIYTTNNDVILKLRQLKIKKIKNND